MARGNYSYRKFQKELARKKKREAKRQRKLDKKNMQANPDSGETANREDPAATT